MQRALQLQQQQQEQHEQQIIAETTTMAGHKNIYVGAINDTPSSKKNSKKLKRQQKNQNYSAVARHCTYFPHAALFFCIFFCCVLEKNLRRRPQCARCQSLATQKCWGNTCAKRPQKRPPLNTLLGERTEMCRGTWGNGQETLHLAAQLGSDILKRLRSAKMIFLSQETFFGTETKII